MGFKFGGWSWVRVGGVVGSPDEWRWVGGYTGIIEFRLVFGYEGGRDDGVICRVVAASASAGYGIRSPGSVL